LFNTPLSRILANAKRVAARHSQFSVQHLLNALRRTRMSTRYEFLVLIMFFGQVAFFGDTQTSFAWFLKPVEALGALGFGLVLWCAIQRYELRGQPEKLITSGPYFYARHPMCLGILVCNLCYWSLCSVWTSPLFLIMELAFLVGLVGAVYYDETETLERFGEEAVEYYKRTPRFPKPPVKYFRR
jgi:protein-S-isoprenylcysteine O-methyltransferase Ste14